MTMIHDGNAVAPYPGSMSVSNALPTHEPKENVKCSRK